jgi:hypothetical protein
MPAFRLSVQEQSCLTGHVPENTVLSDIITVKRVICGSSDKSAAYSAYLTWIINKFEQLPELQCVS